MAPTKPPSDSKTPYKDILSTISTGVKKSTFRPLRARVDLDKCCGVAGDGSASEDVTASPCPKPLRGCQVHSKAQKRAVTGRSCSYDMLIIPAWTSSPRVHGPDVDNGEGSSKGVTKAEVRGREPHFYIGEMSPKVEIPVSKKGGNGKEKATSKDSKEKTLVDDAPARPKGKKRGPKAWTALENEIAKDIREYASHKIPTIEHLEVARKIIEQVRAYNGGDTEELPGGTYRVAGWGS